MNLVEKATRIALVSSGVDLSERQSGQQVHPWEIARAQSVKFILRKQLVSVQRVLDVGCGDAYFISQLANKMRLVQFHGVDHELKPAEISEHSADNLRLHSQLDASESNFDLILFMDVIEHVEDDQSLVREYLHKSVPGAYLLFTVPAYQSLFSDHDRTLRHFRRYNKTQLKSLMDKLDLEVLECSYFFLSLLVPRFVQKLLGSTSKDSKVEGIGAWSQGPLLTRLISSCLYLDFLVCYFLSKLGVQLPGLSLYLLARRRS